MKRKKAFFALIVAVMVVILVGLGVLVTQYFFEQSSRSSAGGDLTIDYLIDENEEETTAEAGQTSKNVFQWLIDQLNSNKKLEDKDTEGQQEDTNSATNSGVTQAKQAEQSEQDDVPEETAKPTKPVESKRPDERKSEDEDADTESEAPKETQRVEKPKESEKPEEEDTVKGQNTVSLTIRCDTAVDKGMNLESQWAGIVPSSGCILAETKMEFEEGDTVFDVLCRARDQYKFQLSYRGTNGAQYIEGINSLYEFDGGRWSGWMYCVNDWYPNYGCGQYAVKSGDVIEWNYTCNLGRDLGQDNMASDEWMDANE